MHLIPSYTKSLQLPKQEELLQRCFVCLFCRGSLFFQELCQEVFKKLKDYPGVDECITVHQFIQKCVTMSWDIQCCPDQKYVPLRLTPTHHFSPSSLLFSLVHFRHSARIIQAKHSKMYQQVGVKQAAGSQSEGKRIIDGIDVVFPSKQI